MLAQNSQASLLSLYVSVLSKRADRDYIRSSRKPSLQTIPKAMNRQSETLSAPPRPRPSKAISQGSGSCDQNEGQRMKRLSPSRLSSRAHQAWSALHEDTGLLTRIGSLLAYALPLTDALRFGDLAIRVGRLGWGGGGTERGCRRGVTCSWDKGHWLTSSGLAGTQLLSFKIGAFQVGSRIQRGKEDTTATEGSAACFERFHNMRVFENRGP